MSPQRCICNKCQCEFFRNLKQYSLLKINDFPVYLKMNSISDTDLSALFFFFFFRSEVPKEVCGSHI